MPRHSHANRLSRLDELAALLQTGDLKTVAELASALHVTPRTVSRDIALLRKRGIPIESSIGKGGGVQLYRRWALSRVFLNYHEALALLLALALTEELGSPLMLQGIHSIRNKLLTTFNPTEQQIIQKLRNRIVVGTPAPDPVKNSCTRPIPPDNSDTIQRAFFEMNRLDIEYEDASNTRTNRVIEPHYLLIAWPLWYLLAWDHLRQDVRAFRLDRILSVTITSETFTLRAEAAFTRLISEIGKTI